MPTCRNRTATETSKIEKCAVFHTAYLRTKMSNRLNNLLVFHVHKTKCDSPLVVCFTLFMSGKVHRLSLSQSFELLINTSIIFVQLVKASTFNFSDDDESH